VGSNFSETGGSVDLLQAVRQAQMIEHLRFDDTFYLPAGKQLELITIDAAKAVGLDSVIGSIEPGKAADIAVFDMEYPRTVPYRDMPVHRLMIDGNGRQVRDVFIDGSPVYLGGRFTKFDPSAVKLPHIPRLGANYDTTWSEPVAPVRRAK